MSFAYTLYMLVILMLSAAVIRLFTPSGRRCKWYAAAVLGALLLRYAISLYLYKNGTNGGTDGLLYHQAAIDIAHKLKAGASLFTVSYPYTWYTWLLGVLYSIFGADRYLASFINAFFALLSGLLIFKIGLKNDYSYRNSVIVSLIFLYMPNLLLWTSDARKEGLLIFLCLLTWYVIQHISIAAIRKIPLTKLIPWIIPLCLLIWLGSLVRIYMFIPVGLGALTSQFFLYKKGSKAAALTVAASVIITSVLVLVFTVYPLSSNHHAMAIPDLEVGSVLQSLAARLKYICTVAFSKNTFNSIFSFVVMPYPWNTSLQDIQGLRAVQSLVSLDMIIWYLCLLPALLGIHKSFKNKNICFTGMAVFIAAYLVLNAVLVENNSGTIYRYRAVILGFTMLFMDRKEFLKVFLLVKDIIGGALFKRYIFKNQ